MTGRFFVPCADFKSIHRDILVDVLRTPEGVEEDVGGAEQHYDITGHVATCPVGNETLQTHHDGETEDHSHKRA